MTQSVGNTCDTCSRQEVSGAGAVDLRGRSDTRRSFFSSIFVNPCLLRAQCTIATLKLFLIPEHL